MSRTVNDHTFSLRGIRSYKMIFLHSRDRWEVEGLSNELEDLLRGEKKQNKTKQKTRRLHST